MFEGFTESAKSALKYAEEAAREMGFNYIGTEHLLLGLAKSEGLAGKILNSAGVTWQALLEKAYQMVGKGDFQFSGEFSLTPRSKRVIELSAGEAKGLNHNYIGSEHILLAILRERDGVAAHLLQGLVNTDTLRQELLRTIKEQEAPGKATATPTLDQFGKDLTAAAKNGELDPVIGRDKEIERMIQILSRRTKNNPILLGEPGVGKSAVVEGLAQRIVGGSIPETLKGKRLVTMDLSGMLAGAKYRGEFEERLKTAIGEIKQSGNVIVFIDEVHTLVGAGAAEGAIDAANILKPMLARGDMQTIGATTLDEYRKYIEKDAALERRFQPVTINEPSQEEAVQILFGLRDRYEAHHKVSISDEAVKQAVKLSARYIADRFLPDKAIDLMDEAASRVRIKSLTLPPDFQHLEDRLAALGKEKEEAVASQNFERAAKLRDEEAILKAEREARKLEWSKSNVTENLAVTGEDIAGIVSGWTGIPVNKLTEGEAARLLQLEEVLKERVIGQDEAVSAVSRAIRRAYAGLKDPRRPIGSFVFLGPTGVGKTELCKALAQAMFGDESAMIRLDMSEYMEKHTVSRLIGAPPGYVGYEEGGQLTEKVHRKPYSVVLLDEIEKAHPDVFNMLLQILEDGRLTDGKGKTISFSNTVLIMTSNVGAGELAFKKNLGFASEKPQEDYESMSRQMREELRKIFRPELLNRIDETIVFRSLTPENIQRIAELMLSEVAKRLYEREVPLTYTKAVAAELAKTGFDPQYGARPLRRAIQRTVEDRLSEELLAGRIRLGTPVELDFQNGAYTITQPEKPAKKHKAAKQAE